MCPPHHQRRRAQNRASQRAFRERKDRHLKGLEYQLENLGEKHHDLMQSYMKQSESVMKLNSRLAELRGQIGAIKSHGPNGGGGGGGGSACSSRSRSGSGSGSFSTGNGDGSNGDRNNSISQNAESFDAFSSFLFSSSPLQRLSPLDEREDPFWQDMTPRPSDPDDVLDENGLPPFEDLLQLK